MNNAMLLNRCLNGEASAWRELVDRYVHLVHSVPARHGLTQAEIEDVGQEVFVALAQHLHQIEDPERLPAWLITTARRFSWRVLKKGRQEQLSLDEMDGESGEQANLSTLSKAIARQSPSMEALFDGWGRQEVLQRAMVDLQERCRQLLTLLFLDNSDPSYDDISRETGLPKGSIGPTRIRCLQQLRANLERQGWNE